MLEYRGLVKFGRLSGEDLALSSCWNSLAAKNDVYEKNGIVGRHGNICKEGNDNFFEGEVIIA